MIWLGPLLICVPLYIARYEKPHFPLNLLACLM